MPDADTIAKLDALREAAELHPRGDFAAHHLRMGPHGMRDAKVTFLDDLDDFGKQLCVINDPCLIGHPLAVAEYIAGLLTEYPLLAAKHREDAATIAALREVVEAADAVAYTTARYIGGETDDDSKVRSRIDNYYKAADLTQEGAHHE